MIHPSEAAFWRAAERVIRMHGADAGTFAAIKADQLLGRVELERMHLWCVIQRRADILLSRDKVMLQ
jgi:hypothetical protein